MVEYWKKGVQGRVDKGEKKLDNPNSIINKIYFILKNEKLFCGVRFEVIGMELYLDIFPIRSAL